MSVSAVIPVKNRPALIAAAIRSCLGQTVVPDEIIVVDDGSDDATPDTVMEMARMDQIEAIAALGALAQETRLALFRLLVTVGPDEASKKAASRFIDSLRLAESKP